MSQMPPPMPLGIQPHRGSMIMVLGILALVLTFTCGLGWILGIISWVMGNADLRAMEAGQMDRTGEGMTKTGKICGMVSVILAVVGIILYVLIFVVFGAAALAGAAASGGAGNP